MRSRIKVFGNSEYGENQEKKSFVGHNQTIWSNQQNTFNHNPSTDSLIGYTVVQLFEENAVNYGSSIAVYSDTASLTYSELNAKANQLANYLRKLGVGRNVLVAVYLERSLELVISLLAIIKAGGAYLPIDIDDTSDRTKVILQDSHPMIILTHSRLAETLKKALSPEQKNNIVTVDKFFEEAVNQEDTDPTPINEHDDLIYVMYTSGSTGKPKGCMIPHRGVVRLVKNSSFFQLDPSDRVAQIASVTFDVMTLEMWGALLNGASLYILPREKLLSFKDFPKALKQNQISFAVLTTSIFNLIAKNYPESFDELKYIIFGGEKANPEIVRLLLERKKKNNLFRLNIVNGYGPTECTNAATAFYVENEMDIKNFVPIGRAITNTKTYILDQNLQFVPAGVIGELYLGGDGLALGYLNDPKATAEKFINSPWDSSETIYKTGDLVYWLPEVGIVFVDRVDTQIKINDIRVELGEIEACIIKHPAIQQVAVIAEPSSDGKKELLAYVRVEEGHAIDPSALYQHVKNSLPVYMIPQKIVQLDNIPLTSHGKVDINKLRLKKGIEIWPLVNNVVYSIEESVAGVWCELLGLEKISHTQNLFDLGTNSLMLMQACVLLNVKLKAINIKNIHITDIITYPSVSSLAKYITEISKNIDKSIPLENHFERANQQKRILFLKKRQNL